MPDGSGLILGRSDNTATLGTSLLRTGSTEAIALFVENEFGGIFGQGRGPDPFPLSPSTIGVRGRSVNGIGVWGSSDNSIGVYGQSNDASSASVWGHHSDGVGVHGSSNAIGVQGDGSGNQSGVFAHSVGGPGVYGNSRRDSGVIGRSETGLAGLFSGDVHVSGSISASGNKPFRIDHPLDPANKYLNHVSVESPQMKNVYDGVAQLDEEGVAWVQLPEYFQELNRDFRYQLSAIGAPAPDLHIAEEVSENRFKIAGGQTGMKVSWQLTGIRKDRWAEANPLEVEQEKGPEERGRYLQPDLYGDESEERDYQSPLPGDRLQELLRQAEEQRQQAEEHRRRMEELQRRRMEGQQEELPPPEAT